MVWTSQFTTKVRSFNKTIIQTENSDQIEVTSLNIGETVTFKISVDSEMGDKKLKINSCSFISGETSIEIIANQIVIELFAGFVKVLETEQNNEVAFDFNVFQIGHEKSGQVIKIDNIKWKLGIFSITETKAQMKCDLIIE